MRRCLVAVTFQLCALSRSFLNLLIPGASYDFCEAFAFCCPCFEPVNSMCCRLRWVVPSEDEIKRFKSNI
ncbi:hypothetical protein CICLE_v10033267mg [Citrus x clementina]|uniref:Secreted protein n=1 Tax=Citrus clementina TaxID=85681 RepID=V4TIL6_CITCL|nr:hypothetical protein CICLE_v10033267mg [Citrus x clementina]